MNGLAAGPISSRGTRRAAARALSLTLPGHAPPIWQGKICQTRGPMGWDLYGPELPTRFGGAGCGSPGGAPPLPHLPGSIDARRLASSPIRAPGPQIAQAVRDSEAKHAGARNGRPCPGTMAVGRLCRFPYRYNPTETGSSYKPNQLAARSMAHRWVCSSGQCCYIVVHDAHRGYGTRRTIAQVGYFGKSAICSLGFWRADWVLGEWGAHRILTHCQGCDTVILQLREP